MKDYFGALMRASGMLGTFQQAVQLPVIDEQVSAPEQAREPSQATGPEQAATPGDETLVISEVHGAEPTVPVDIMSSRIAAVPPSVSDDVPAAPQAHASAAMASADGVDAAPSAVSTPPSPEMGRAVLNAALRWIAASDSNVDRASSVAKSETSAHARSSIPSNDPSPAAPLVMPVTPPDAPAAVSRHANALIANVRGQPPIRQARSESEPIRSDDRVEVSIGAIHVRLDPPAANHIAPAPDAIAARASARVPAARRSSLSRRLLHRI